MAKTLLTSGKPAGTLLFATASVTRYLNIAGGLSGEPSVAYRTLEARAQLVFPQAGVIRNLKVLVDQNARTTDTTFRTRINGAFGNQIVTFASTVSGLQSDTTHSDNIAANDLVCVAMTTLVGAQNIGIVTIQVEFEATSGTIIHYAFSGADNLSNTGNATLYQRINGASRATIFGWSTTRDYTSTRTPVLTAGTFSHLRVNIIANTSDVTSTFVVHKNGAATGLTVSFAPTVTGAVIDSTNTFTVAPGDFLELACVTTGRTVGGITVGMIQMTCTSSSTKWDMYCGLTDGAFPTSSATAAVRNYYGPGHGRIVFSASETNAVLTFPFPATIKGYGTGATGSGTGDVHIVRVNSVDTSITVTVPFASGVSAQYSDLAHVAPLAINDVVSLSYTPASSNTTGPYVAVLQVDSAPNTEATGAIGTVTMSAVNATVASQTHAGGPIGTVIMSAPAASGASHTFATGPIGTVTMFTPVLGMAQARDTQQGMMALTLDFSGARVTQFALQPLALTSVDARTTIMGLLVLAKGGETPLVPDPLSLVDAGRNSVLVQRLVNMYSEPTPQGPAASVRYQRPGLYEVIQRGAGPIRASFIWKGFRITVSGDQVWRDSLNIGFVPATGKLRFAISDEECVVIAGSRAYYVTLTDVARITDPDLPFVRDVRFMNGRFIYVADDTSGMFLWSEINDARNIDRLSFASAESSPDPIIGCEVLGDSILFFGLNTVEWWYGSTDPTAPFQRSSGRRYDKGTNSILSIVLVDNSLMWVGNDRMVYRTGAAPMKISTFDIDNRLRAVTDAELPDVTAWTCTFGGHTFLVINLPGQGSHAYDVGSNGWAEWRSWGDERFRVDVASENYLGDSKSGRIMGFNGDLYTDIGEPIERIVSSYAPNKSGIIKNFNLALHCKRGVGLVPYQYGSEPVVEMRFSDGEGYNWSDWLEQPLGVAGDHGETAKAIWMSLGSFPSPGRLFEFRCTDPVQFAPYRLVFNEARP